MKKVCKIVFCTNLTPEPLCELVFLRPDFKSFGAKLTGTFILSNCNQLVRLAMN